MAEAIPDERDAAKATHLAGNPHARYCVDDGVVAADTESGVDATTATVTGCDRLGVDMVATGDRGTGRVRIGFAEPATTPEEVRRATVVLVHRAREGNHA